METKKADELLFKLESKVSFRAPINTKEEKTKFFNSGNTYNPQFVYKQEREIVKYALLEEAINRIQDPKIRRLYSQKMLEYKRKEELLSFSGLSAPDFTNKSVELFGKPDKVSVKQAKRVVERMPSIRFGRKHKPFIRFHKLQKEIKAHLKDNNFKGKLVVRDNKSTLNNVSISKQSGDINISKNYIADQDELIDILYHELETHMRRLENGRKLPYGIFALGTAGYLKHEEGLATLTGHAFKKNKNLWHPALLLIAMDVAYTEDFVTVYDTINNLIKSPFRSWSYAVRVKSGLGDTSKPGTYTKDLYFKWLIETGKELLEDESLLGFAYNGKASFVELRSFTQAQTNPQGLTVETIQTIFKENAIPYE